MMGGGGGGRWGGRGGGVGPRKPENFRLAVKKTIPWMIPVLPILLFGLFATIVGGFLGQQPPRIYQYTIDKVITPGLYHDLPKVLAVYIGVIILGQAIRSASGYWMSVAGQRVLHALRMKLYGQFQALSLSYYDDKRVGDLLSRVTGDVGQLENLIVNTIISLISQFVNVGFAFYFMWKYHWMLALLVLVPMPIIGVSVYLFTRRVRVIYRAIRESTGDLSAKLQENLSGIRVIKAFNREVPEYNLVNDTSNHLLKENLRASRMSTLFYPAISSVTTMGTVIVLGVGTYLISRGQFTVGMLIAFIAYVGNFYSPIFEFIRTFDSIQRALASGERIFEVLDAVPAVQDPPHPRSLEHLRGEVEFRDVSFRYATGEEVLKGISMHARPGQRVALVGESGAGKSSFINLIPRFYDVTGGAVLIDGIDVRQVRQADLRSHISMVLQETFLFNGTVRENLLFGRDSATDEEIVEAAKAANAHDFIERLPDGYETQIGERGVKLSGGQKQRIAIARAVLANPRILILDEATSSVDSESEFLIHQALDRLMGGRTTFIIAHRLSTIRGADVILVLDGGNIAERGSHDELYAQDGRYAQMYRQQFWLDDLADDESLPDDERVMRMDN